MLRRGLPRVKGGEAWPPATTVEGAAPMQDRFLSERSETKGAESTGSSREEPVQSAAGGAPAAPVAADSAAPVAAAPAPVAAASAPLAAAPASSGGALRRGLPRVAGGDPWPPAGAAAAAGAATAASNARDLAESTGTPGEQPVQSTASGAVAPQAGAAQPSAVQSDAVAQTTEGAALRRGLPRVAGGDPWPPAGAARIRDTSSQPLHPSVAQTQETAADAVVTPAASAGVVAPSAGSGVEETDVSTPLPFTRTVWQGRAPRHAAEPLPEPSKLRPAWPQAIGGLIGLASLGLLAVAAVFFVRTFLSLPFMQDFLAAYPGEYHPAIEVEPGFAPWANWAHFFNMFLMVLIIRSGLRVRSEKRPTAFWTPRGNGKGKISLTLWFHQALDILWLVNGVVFVVLLIVTGHWARIVPTSWEVFPNALSAGLQYVSFDWPTDNGWVNYNSLQQLAYFATVFIAAPLAAITGFRMSGLWPKKAEKLSKAYPVEWARALHFPVMLYFVAFIIVHVALVFLTGALRNLNHMFAAQGSVDGTAYASVWTGFWVFVAAMVVIAAGWFAARPLVLAPIAKLFGQVSGR
ncbi:cytochrome b/b6 domain-containing protein [Microbacterium sp. Mu-80]|uniref:Cytochrome b/b6 domain-containing protein n=1 Tax=Microbacterium bandirmense TaxID=3122050 RepID=A0ABU8LAI5_9MICO